MHDRRSYWIEQMDDAYAFMQRLLVHPLRECGEPLASLPDAAREHGVEIDFPPGKKLNQFERVFRVRRSLVDRVLAVAVDLLKRDCVLRVEDAYRSLDTQTQGAGSDFMFHTVLAKVVWELRGKSPSAELLFRRIAVLTATTPKFANHMYGSAIDVSILHRRDRTDVDRGGPYLELSEKTPMGSPFVSAAARRNRDWINEVFSRHGFLPYPYEFWHYSHGDPDYQLIAGLREPAHYGPIHWRPDTGDVEPVTHTLRQLLTVEHIRARLQSIPCRSPHTTGKADPCRRQLESVPRT